MNIVTSATEALIIMGDDSFRDLVDKDLRRKDREDIPQELRDGLRSPEVADRWLSTLIKIAKSVEGTLAYRYDEYEAEKADLELKGDQTGLYLLKQQYHQQRAKTLRFKTGLDEWLIEARTIRDARRRQDPAASERALLERKVRSLKEAIEEHHSAAVAADRPPASYDQKLWSVLI